MLLCESTGLSMNDQTPELGAFRAHYKKLVDVIQNTPETLSAALFSKGIISRELNAEVTIVLGISPAVKAHMLMNAVYGKISENPANLSIFLTALREEPPLVTLADSILDNLKREASILISLVDLW